VLQARVASQDRERSASVWAAPRRASWWLAVGLNTAGAGLHVLALRYGPLTIIQPLGALTLVLALPLQAVVVGRRVAALHWRGAVLTVSGLAGVLLLVRGENLQVLAPRQALGVVATTTTTLGALGVAARAARPQLRSITYAAASGLAFSVASVLTQAVALRPKPDAFTLLTALSVAALAPVGLMLAQAAYRGGLGAPLATATLVNPAVSAAVGLTLLGEQLSGGVTGAAAALLAAAAAVRGVTLLSCPASAAVERTGPRPTERRRTGALMPQAAVATGPARRTGRAAGPAPAPKTSSSAAVADCRGRVAGMKLPKSAVPAPCSRGVSVKRTK
jgi:hypothetical protein